ncbi:excinuclease Cho [Diaphorobacter caeni]|uniref:excinuclease Cho n=1 Tax=Diaphorobacter caeni TaxID=2784387 RepID=UPI00188F2E07|nr:excinuclease Cho [Diaphorobacter caeni]MBF5006820.1 excinuclease Cho [Diaphorobacter caeni]
MPRRHRLPRSIDFPGDPLIYSYPEHLREQLTGLPAAPGVYLFHGDASFSMPLYIGKSVNIRSRVMAHLRTPAEAAMLRQAVRISFIRTAGEIGALLLEAQLIKQHQPLHNRKLRRNRLLCTISLQDGVPIVLSSRDVDFASTPDLFGLFSSRRAALEALHALADMNKLCYGVLGLERVPNGRPCFRSMIKMCLGACNGAESRAEHDARLVQALEALRVATWPFKGAVGLVESFDGDEEILVVNNWCFLGAAKNRQEAKLLGKVARGFDADGYKVLCKPIMQQAIKIIAL